VFHIITV